LLGAALLAAKLAREAAEKLAKMKRIADGLPEYYDFKSRNLIECYG